ncbi:MAG: hypothetical protein KC431_16025, partial [Myxococcales bacterium]|nr:hypothetical protein [Myxococcales bacterium]
MSGAPISRRGWLWTSTGLVAAACARPRPSQVPATGPEPARPLLLRGAENLIALAELAAAIRCLHPADQVQQIDWEPMVLAGVRTLEDAGDREELLAGLRGLFATVAPTVVIWRSEAEDE